MKSAASKSEAKRWVISGRVQGVGFRYFVQKKAQELGLSGWARNLSEGSLEVFAQGIPAKLNDLAAALHIGPRMADVRAVEEMEAVPENRNGFHIH